MSVDPSSGWVAWIAPSGLLVISGVLGYFWHMLDDLRRDVQQMPHEAQKTATEMDGKIWDELRGMREAQNIHVQRMNDMHVENVRFVSKLPTRDEMMTAIDRSAERVVQAINRSTNHHEND